MRIASAAEGRARRRASQIGLRRTRLASTTGSTNPRRFGFDERDRDLAARCPATPAPRWYFTSPEPLSRSAETVSRTRSPSNSRRIASTSRPTVWASTLSRPRCAMPSTTRLAPSAAASSIASSSIGTMTSSPSMENCFCPRKARRQIALEALDVRQAAEKGLLLLGCERAPERAGLDRFAQPESLLVARDVLQLERHRPAVRLAATGSASTSVSALT